VININILTNQTPFKRGYNIFFPLIKWKKEFTTDGIKFSFIDTHKTEKIYNSDIIIIDYRYFFHLINKKIYHDNQFIIDVISKAKRFGIKVILFDTADSSGSRCFDLTPYVDLHLKKQLRRDLNEYTINKGAQSVRCWVPGNDNFAKSKLSYTECAPEQIKKLKLGWNIGMVDYRYFPMSKFYPIGTSNLLNQIYQTPKPVSPYLSKPLVTSFRGNVHQDPVYSYQRRILIDTLKQIDDLNIGRGRPLSKSKYYKELSRSKIVISPYGWGEICYRDFEAFIFGSVLLKPSMEHLITFPDVYIENESYISLKWDMSDLKEKLYFINNSDQREIAQNAQKKFMNIITDCHQFIEHFKKNLIE
jgi:hypothetical protein